MDEFIQVVCIIDKLTFKFVKASGPGGQNTNKVNTKVDMRFYIYKASWLSESVKTRLIEQHQHKVNAAGQFCITSDQYRTQEANRMDCLQKLKTYILEASQEPGETSDAQKAHVHALHRKQQLRVKKEKMERASIKRDRVKGGNKYSAD